MIRVGLVGCGRMGEIHLQVLNSLQGVRVVGVADLDRDRADALAERGSVDVVTSSLESLLETARPDAVHILTPPATHAALAITALSAGCHVFVEKPLALSTHEAELMAAAVQQGRLLTVGHNHLFDPVIQEAQERIAQGRLGQILGLDAFHGALPGLPPWVAELPSGPWTEDAPHLLYLSQLFMGDVLAVQAVGYPAGKALRATEVRVLARHASGLSTLAFSEATVPYQHWLTLFGTARTLRVDLITGTLIENRPFGGHRWLRKGLATLDSTAQPLLSSGRRAFRVLTGRERSWPGLRALIAAFYRAIREGGPSPIPIAQGVRVVELLEEIRHCLTISAEDSQSSA